MSFEQAGILLLLVGMLVVFALDRLRMEVVALSGLGLAALAGLLPAPAIFSGLSSPAFVTVVELLLIAQVLGRSGLFSGLAGRISAAGWSTRSTSAILCAVTAVISVFMNNIAALALMIPVVFSVCRATALDPRRVLMPVGFAALLGGLCSLSGTPANLIVSQQLGERTGRAFAFFDFAYVGVPVMLAGVIVTVFWTGRALRDGGAGMPGHPGQMRRRVVTEAVIPPGSAFVGTAVAALPARVHALIRNDRHVLRRPQAQLEVGDILLLEAESTRVSDWIAEGMLARLPFSTALTGRPERVEAVIMPESTLVGSRLRSLESFHSRGIRILAVAAQTPRIEGRFDDLQLSIGDILYLEGDRDAIDEAVEETELLSLWPTPQRPEDGGTSRLPLGIFAAGVVACILGAAPPLAFGGVVLVLAAAGSLNLRRGLAELDWPILIMLAAMIPLGQAVETTGAAAVLADGLMHALPGEHPLVMIGAVLLLAVVVTPFVNNASTAIVLAPIAMNIAGAAALPPEPFLIAVALGASIDFLTPVGHHNNTIVMGIAGYRFADFLRIGWPATLAACATAILAIPFFWM